MDARHDFVSRIGAIAYDVVPITIVATGGIGAEPLVHFVKGPGIIGSGNGTNSAFHLRMVAPSVAGVVWRV